MEDKKAPKNRGPKAPKPRTETFLNASPVLAREPEDAR